jgi:hypothetical protein
MFRCKASEIPRNEAYIEVRRIDEAEVACLIYGFLKREGLSPSG